MPFVEQVESHTFRDLKDVEKNPGADYSGAVAKSDPKEIALVKKLDRRIMPILWAMYFMNYVSLQLSGSLDIHHVAR